MNANYVMFIICIDISINVWAKVPKTSATKHHQAYAVESADTKWIHTSQLDSILMSIEEKLHQISEKQKQDATVVRISNDLEIISHRLQNVEEQIARAESYNKMRLEQLIESTMKSEFLIDQLGRRIEKYQQQMMSRLTEIDASIEKSNKAQENLEKNIRKIEVLQNQVTTSLEELNGTVKKVRSETSETLLHVNTTRQRFEERFDDVLQNITSRIISPEVSNANSSIHSQNDVVQMGILPINDLQKAMKDELDKAITTIDKKHDILLQDSLLLKASTEECRSLSNKIYNKVTSDQSDVGDYLDTFLETLTQEIKSEYVQISDKFDFTLKNNIDLVLNEQHLFMNNCHRLQVNEEQIEDKVVTILQNLFNYIDNRTERARHDLEILLNFESAHDSNLNSLIEELTRFIKRENNELKNAELDSASHLSTIRTNVSRLANDMFMLRNSLYLLSTNMQQHMKQFLPALNDKNENVSSPIIDINPKPTHQPEDDHQRKPDEFLKNPHVSTEIVNPSKAHVINTGNISNHSLATNNTRWREIPVTNSRFVRSSLINTNSSDATASVSEQNEYENNLNESVEDYD